MGYRIAVATTDGKVVNQHFGKADKFYIIEIKQDNTWELVNILEVEPICNQNNHDEDMLNQLVRRLEDCKYVIVSQIGYGAETALNVAGIKAYSIRDEVTNAVNWLILHHETEEK